MVHAGGEVEHGGDAAAAALRVLYVTSQWPRPDRPLVAPFTQREVESLRGIGVGVDVFPYRGGFSLAAYWRAARALRQRLAAERYDVIHARFGQCGLVALTQRSVPVVVTFGGSDVEGLGRPGFVSLAQSRLLTTVSRWVAARADGAIVVAEHMIRFMPTRAYHVVPAGVNLDAFQPADRAAARARLGLPAEGRIALFPANPDWPRKRWSLAQQACEIARATVPVELVALRGIEPARVPDYMNACDALLLTSRNEGSPNVVKEALACNLPVVSTDVGDVRQRIQGLPGCEVCDDDPSRLAAALVRALRGGRPELRHAVLELDLRRTAARTAGVYREAIARRARAH
jgi:glycosyltransferase involved in cell wall biosynthesis